MPEWTVQRCLVLAVVAACLSAPSIMAATDTPAAEKQPLELSPEQVNELVGQLGAGSFLLRERASRRLLDVGLPAKAALEQALSHPDAEVRLRAEKVLGVILERDFNVRLEAFAADIEGRQDHHLPGWGRFQQTVGSNAAARQLFLQMQRSEPAVMQSAESGGKLAAATLQRRLMEIEEVIEQDNLRGDVPVGRAAALMFAATPNDVLLSDDVANHISNGAYQTEFLQAAANGPQAPALKKLLAAWVSRTEGLGADARQQNMMFALRLSLPEGLRPATSLLTDQSLQAYQRPYVILAVAKLGSKEHLPLLAPLLDDDAQCNEMQVGEKVYSIQVRDVALAASLELTGQDPKAFGFERVQRNELYVFEPSSLLFTSKKKRKAAFAKWKEFSAKAAAGEQP